VIYKYQQLRDCPQPKKSHKLFAQNGICFLSLPASFFFFFLLFKNDVLFRPILNHECLGKISTVADNIHIRAVVFVHVLYSRSANNFYFILKDG